MQRIRSIINLVTEAGAVKSALRAVVFGRGRRRRFGVPPTIRQFRKLFTTYPMMSNAVTYGGLCVGAEYCQQLLKHSRGGGGAAMATPHPPKMDSGSLKRYAAWGFFVIPPIYHKWYKWLDGAFRTSGPLNKKVMVQKLFLDQFVLTPVVLVMFFVAMAAMEGQSDITQECKSKFGPTFLMDCLFWLPVQFFNFRFVPADMRVVFIGVTTFVWLNVLCFIKSLPVKSFQNGGAAEIPTPAAKCVQIAEK